MAYLYILECADGSFYTGSTLDLGYRWKWFGCKSYQEKIAC